MNVVCRQGRTDGKLSLEAWLELGWRVCLHFNVVMKRSGGYVS